MADCEQVLMLKVRTARASWTQENGTLLDAVRGDGDFRGSFFLS